MRDEQVIGVGSVMLLGGGREASFSLKVEQLEGGTARLSNSTENL